MISNDKKIKLGILYFSNKFAIFVLSVIILSVIVFWISRLTPTDPLQSYYGERTEKMTVEQKAAAREKLGLNDPITVQYVRWIEEAVRGDFGISYKYKQPVLAVIQGRAGNTIILGGIGFLLTFAGALAVGMLCARHEGSIFDRIMCKAGTFSSCIPEFWLALVLILLFCVTWKILPSSGAYTIGKESSLADRIRHLILPMLVIVLGHLWYYAYMIRNMLIDEGKKDYVLLCRSKGLKRNQIITRHCLRNILPEYISMMAVSVPHILGGTYIVEMVFSYPGLGTLSYESARYDDYNMLMVMCLLTGIIVIFSNMLGQIISEQIDPRVHI